jgi:hypothetical protein
VRKHSHTHTHSLTHTRAHTHIHTHRHTHTHTYTNTHVHTFTHKPTRGVRSFEKALNLYKDLMQMEDCNPMVPIYAAACYYYMGMYKEAEESAEQVGGEVNAETCASCLMVNCVTHHPYSMCAHNHSCTTAHMRTHTHTHTHAPPPTHTYTHTHTHIHTRM